MIKTQTQQEELKGRILASGTKAMDIVDAYLIGEVKDDSRVPLAQKLMVQVVKVLHMDQVKTLTERSQALRLLQFLPDDRARREYIKLTNPQAAPLLLARPKGKSFKN